MSGRGLEVGSTLGKYQILSRLGQGGMASVYKAFQPSLEREVALKVLRAGFAEDEEFLDRFRREAKAIAHLRHPHIVQVFDFEEVDGRAFMAMEYLDGGTLKERMSELAKSGRRLPQDEVVGIVSQVADALTYAHRLGIVHRDVKPSNVMLLSDGRAVVTDFGIAKVLSGTQHTQTGVGVGTPEYMSPEQGQGKGVDQRADIYSLGIMTYELLTGRVPFTADTPLAIVLAHMRDPLPLPSQIEPSVGPATERVLLKSLAKDAEQRYESARAFADALRAGVAEDEGGETMPTIFVGGPAAAAAATVAPLAATRPVARAPAVAASPPASTAPAATSLSALLLQRPGLVAGTAVALVAVLVIGAALAFARGGGAPADAGAAANASNPSVATARPTAATPPGRPPGEGAVAPTGLSAACCRGSLVYELRSASDVNAFPGSPAGAVTFQAGVLRISGTGVSLRTSPRTVFVAELSSSLPIEWCFLVVGHGAQGYCLEEQNDGGATVVRKTFSSQSDTVVLGQGNYIPPASTTASSQTTTASHVVVIADGQHVTIYGFDRLLYTIDQAGAQADAPPLVALRGQPAEISALRVFEYVAPAAASAAIRSVRASAAPSARPARIRWT